MKTDEVYPGICKINDKKEKMEWGEWSTVTEVINSTVKRYFSFSQLFGDSENGAI